MKRRETLSYQHDLGLLVESHGSLKALGCVPSEGPFMVYGRDSKPVALTHPDDILACQAYEMLSQVEPGMPGVYGRKGLIKFFGNFMRAQSRSPQAFYADENGALRLEDPVSRYKQGLKTVLGVDVVLGREIGPFAYEGAIDRLTQYDTTNKTGEPRDWQSVAGFTPKLEALKCFPPTAYKKAGWKIFQETIQAVKARHSLIDSQVDYQCDMLDVALALILQRCNISVRQADEAFAREADRGHNTASIIDTLSLWSLFSKRDEDVADAQAVDSFIEVLQEEPPFTTETITSPSAWKAFALKVESKAYTKYFTSSIAPAIEEAKACVTACAAGIVILDRLAEDSKRANAWYYGKMPSLNGGNTFEEMLSEEREYLDAYDILEKLRTLKEEAMKALQKVLFGAPCIGDSEECVSAECLIEAEDPLAFLIESSQGGGTNPSSEERDKGLAALDPQFAPSVTKLKDLGFPEEEIVYLFQVGIKWQISPEELVEIVENDVSWRKYSEPWLDISWENETHEIVVLPRGHLFPPFMGLLTSCCQHIVDGAAKDCARRSATVDHCVVYRKKGTIKPLFQAYVWRSKGYLVCDNIEPKDASPEVIRAWQEWGRKCASEGGYKDVLVGKGYMTTAYGPTKRVFVHAPSSYSDYKNEGYSLCGFRNLQVCSKDQWFTDLFGLLGVRVRDIETRSGRFVMQDDDDDADNDRVVYSLGDLYLNSGLSGLLESIDDAVFASAMSKLGKGQDEIELIRVISSFKTAFHGYVTEEIDSLDALDPMAIYIDCRLPDGTEFSTGPDGTYVGVNGIYRNFPRNYVSMEIHRLLSDMGQDPEPYEHEDYDYFFGGAK